MNIFELPGPAFLAVYVVAMVLGTITAWMVRASLRRKREHVDARSLHLLPTEIAYLSGGEQQAVQAAVASLAHRDLLTVDDKSRALSANSIIRTGADAFETGVQSLMIREARTVEALTSAAQPILEPVRRKLMSLGLLESGETTWKLRVAPAAVVGVVVLLGVVKMSIGASRQRPVVFLGLLTFIAVLEALWFFRRPPWRSLTGDSVVAALKARYSALAETAKAQSERVTPDDLALAVGLYGASVLVSGPLHRFGRALAPPVQSSDSSSTSSCSSGSSGCGGGGGGGCGGCGS